MGKKIKRKIQILLSFVHQVVRVTYVMLCYITCAMLCYITCVMICYITYVMSCYLIYHVP